MELRLHIYAGTGAEIYFAMHGAPHVAYPLGRDFCAPYATVQFAAPSCLKGVPVF